MYEKYRNAAFGRCPHVFCQGQPVLPVGLSDLPRNYTVNVFCPRCHGLFFPKSTRQANIDGAYFGTTFPHLYLMTHPVSANDDGRQARIAHCIYSSNPRHGCSHTLRFCFFCRIWYHPSQRKVMLRECTGFGSMSRAFTILIARLTKMISSWKRRHGLLIASPGGMGGHRIAIPARLGTIPGKELDEQSNVKRKMGSGESPMDDAMASTMQESASILFPGAFCRVYNSIV
jgi:hypothetical protein